MKKIVCSALVTGLMLTMMPTPAQAVPQEVASVSPAAERSKNDSARSLFESIWFATGDQALELQEKIDSTAFRAYLQRGDQSRDSLRLAREVGDSLEDQKHGYLRNLQKELTSGDVYRVEAALASTSTDVVNVIQKLYPTKVALARSDGGASGDCLWVLAVAAVAVWSGVVLVNYAGIVNVAGAVNAVGWFNASVAVNVSSPRGLETSTTTETDRAATEDIVASLTAGLAKKS